MRGPPVCLRDLSLEEVAAVHNLARSHTAGARRVERARIIQQASQGETPLIEPWRKILRSLALAGRRFASWGDVVVAVEKATAYWNAHRHPFVWGRRRRHKLRRQPGIALLPKAA